VSSSQEIQSIRATEQRYPADLVHNGRSYKLGYKVQSESIRKLRAVKRERNYAER
jgi:hypothetical protein